MTRLEIFANNGVCEPFYWLTRPSAVYYNGRTYIVWHGTNLDPYITYYDHTTKTWAPVKRVGDSPLVNDDHGAPSLQIDNNGYIYVFYGSHSSNQKWAKSASPENINTFIAQQDIAGGYTYPKPIKVGNSIYLFLRSNPYNETYIIWNGASWGSLRTIIKSPSSGQTSNYPDWTSRVYTGFMELVNNKIHMTWVYQYYSNPDIDDRRNVFYAYLDLTDMNMYSITGRNLGVTISQTEAETYCMVRNTGANTTTTPSMHFDSNGYPWIIYIEGTGTAYKFYHTRWNGSSWTTPMYITTTDSGDDNYGDFIINSVTDVNAYLTTSGKAGFGGDIEEWRWNGTTWSKVSTILSESASGKPLGGPNVPYNFNPELKLVFSQYLDEIFTDNTLKLYAVLGELNGCPPLSVLITMT